MGWRLGVDDEGRGTGRGRRGGGGGSVGWEGVLGRLAARSPVRVRPLLLSAPFFFQVLIGVEGRDHGTRPMGMVLPDPLHHRPVSEGEGDGGVQIL